MMKFGVRVTKASVQSSLLTATVQRNILAWTCRSASFQATFKTRPFKLHKLDSGPSDEVTVTKDEALLYYRQMQTIRRLETAAGNLYKEKKIRGFCHLYSGQEACAVGMKASMDTDDALITAYRCHGWTYLLGSAVAEVLSELAGRAGGNVHGKGGSMHMYAKNFYGGNGIVGAQQPLGTGIAFAMKYRKKKNVCLTLYGDGAANQGQLFEAVNMARLWNLPVLYICENNGYGMGTSAARSSASTDYFTRGDYIPGIWVDGMDVLAVKEAVRWSKKYCDEGLGPLMLEMATYRYSGHSMSDPGTSYRTREEIQSIRKQRDPIAGFKDRVITAGLISEGELKEIDKSVRKEVDEAVEKSLTDDYAPVEIAYADIYHNTPPQILRGSTPDKTVVQPFVSSADALESFQKRKNI
ncbi:hypothetical protein AB6A40_003475 [Gnathostoma spinigerum]|uniref:Pyruvate dehydrogenase E1 component subunit alpha n=1 Tax=Gnathostoma spinigerum TaxID=75299 RepID=A0ABD6EHA4_9BILA